MRNLAFGRKTKIERFSLSLWLSHGASHKAQKRTTRLAFVRQKPEMRMEMQKMLTGDVRWSRCFGGGFESILCVSACLGVVCAFGKCLRFWARSKSCADNVMQPRVVQTLRVPLLLWLLWLWLLHVCVFACVCVWELLRVFHMCENWMRRSEGTQSAGEPKDLTLWFERCLRWLFINHREWGMLQLSVRFCNTSTESRPDTTRNI